MLKPMRSTITAALLALGPLAIQGCVALATSDALVLVEGNLSIEHGQCAARVSKTTFKYADRQIKGPFKLDYTAGPADTWFEVEIRCDDGASFKRKFARVEPHLDMGNL